MDESSRARVMNAVFVKEYQAHKRCMYLSSSWQVPIDILPLALQDQMKEEEM